jgi:RimJ/RimL family protein N-acetyltransferase
MLKGKIETDRLVLRKFSAEDITTEYVRALNDKGVVKFVDVRHKKWDARKVREYVDTHDMIGIFLKTGKHIGNIQLHPFYQENRVDLGILLWNKNEWGRGYGTEALKAITDYALNSLGFNKIRAGYYPENKASAKMFKKAGYRVEAYWKDNIIFYGKTTDNIWVSKFAKGKGKARSPGIDRALKDLETAVYHEMGI